MSLQFTVRAELVEAPSSTSPAGSKEEQAFDKLRPNGAGSTFPNFACGRDHEVLA